MSNFEDTPLGQDIQKKGSWFARQTLGKLVFYLVLVIVVLSVGTSALGFALNWFHTGTAIISPDNVKTQFAHGYSDYESLKATAGNYCTANQAYKTETDPLQKSQRETQVLAYQANYNRIAADYDQAYENVFQGKLVKPSDLPSRAPTLQEMVKQVC